MKFRGTPLNARIKPNSPLVHTYFINGRYSKEDTSISPWDEDDSTIIIRKNSTPETEIVKSTEVVKSKQLPKIKKNLTSKERIYKDKVDKIKYDYNKLVRVKGIDNLPFFNIKDKILALNAGDSLSCIRINPNKENLEKLEKIRGIEMKLGVFIGYGLQNWMYESYSTNGSKQRAWYETMFGLHFIFYIKNKR